MEETQIIGIISQIFTASSVIPYTIGIMKGNIKPNVVTWSIWSVVGLTILLTTWTNPNTDKITVMFAGILAFNPIVILILTIKKGEFKKISNTEKLATIIAMMAIGLWLNIEDKENIWPTILAITADVCALMPTLIFVVRYPQHERPLTWGLFVIGAIMTIIGIKEWNLESTILPLYMLIGAIMIFIPLTSYRIKNKIPLKEWV